MEPYIEKVTFGYSQTTYLIIWPIGQILHQVSDWAWK